MIQPLYESQKFLSELGSEAEIHRVPFAEGYMTWRRFGSGKPMVLLHGGHGRWTHWARNIHAWAKRFTVWIPDLPGYGDSDLPSQPTLESLVDSTLQTLDSLVPRSEPLAIVAFSFGSLVAVMLAVKRGEVTRMVLLGPAGHGGVRRPRGELRPWRGQEIGSPSWHEVMRHNLLMHMIYQDVNADALAVHIHSDACIQTRFHSKSLSRAGRLPALLAHYQGPLLLIWGEHDVTAIPDQVAEILTAGRTRCEFEVVEGVGHWVQYEAAFHVNDRVQTWLTASFPNTLNQSM